MVMKGEWRNHVMIHEYGIKRIRMIHRINDGSRQSFSISLFNSLFEWKVEFVKIDISGDVCE